MPKGQKRPRNVGRLAEGLNLADPRWERPVKRIGLGPNVDPKFALFTVPPVDESVASRRVVEIPPSVSGQINPIEFEIKPSTEYVDLSSSFFMLKLRLQAAGGGNIAADTYPCQNLCHTMLKQVSVYVNGVLTTVQSDTYALNAMLQTILNHDEDDAVSVLRPQGFIPGALNVPNVYAANTWDSATPHANYTALTGTAKTSVDGVIKERRLYTGGVRRTLVFKPLVEVFHLNKPLPPNTRVLIRMHFNEPAYFAYGGTAPRLVADDVDLKMYVSSLRLKAPLYNTLTHLRDSNHYMQYPVVRYETRTFTLPDGETNFDKADIFEQRIPNRVFVYFLDSRAFNGTIGYSPFAFRTFGVEWIKQLINGEEYPHTSTLELQHDSTSKDYDGYHRFLYDTGALKRGRKPLVRPEDWGYNKNCTIFCFNNVESGDADSRFMNPQNQGNHRIQARFNAGIGHAITICVTGEFENVMKITREGGVLYETYNGM